MSFTDPTAPSDPVDDARQDASEPDAQPAQVEENLNDGEQHGESALESDADKALADVEADRVTAEHQAAQIVEDMHGANLALDAVEALPEAMEDFSEDERLARQQAPDFEALDADVEARLRLGWQTLRTYSHRVAADAEKALHNPQQAFFDRIQREPEPAKVDLNAVNEPAHEDEA